MSSFAVSLAADVAAVLVEPRLADRGLELLGDIAAVVSRAWRAPSVSTRGDELSGTCMTTGGLAETGETAEEVVPRDLRYGLASTVVGLTFRELLRRRSRVELMDE